MPAGEWGANLTGKFVSGAAGMLGAMEATAISERNARPWKDSGGLGDWLRAIGCKP
jgi:hypothetical protein